MKRLYELPPVYTELLLNNDDLNYNVTFVKGFFNTKMSIEYIIPENCKDILNLLTASNLNYSSSLRPILSKTKFGDKVNSNDIYVLDDFKINNYILIFNFTKKREIVNNKINIKFKNNNLELIYNKSNKELFYNNINQLIFDILSYYKMFKDTCNDAESLQNEESDKVQVSADSLSFINFTNDENELIHKLSYESLNKTQYLTTRELKFYKYLTGVFNLNDIKDDTLKESIKDKLKSSLPNVNILDEIPIRITYGNTPKHIDINSKGIQSNSYAIYMNNYKGNFVLINDDNTIEKIPLKKIH